MKKFASVLLACAVVLAMLLPVTAYAAHTTKLSIAQIRQQEGDLYLYLTGVNDRGEAELESLMPSDYTVTMSGTPLQVTSVDDFSNLNETTHYVVCVDVSKSIGGSNFTKDTKERDEVRDALASMINGLRDNERMSVYTFGNTVETVAEFKKRDSDTLSKAAANLEFNGNYTALYEVINKGTNAAKSNSDRAPRSAVLIITDGTDDPGYGGASNYSFETIKEDVRKRNVPVYIATFYRRENSDGKESLSQLRELADISGGEFFSLGSFEEGYRMTEVLTNLQQLTRSCTRLTAQLHSDLEHGDGTFKVNMVMQDGSLDTLDHSFGVNWGTVPQPTPEPDVVLDKLEVGEVTEDSTSIHVVTEPEATVRIVYDNNKRGEIQADATGQGDFDFSSWLSDSFSIEQNHTFVVTAKDKGGFSVLPDGKEARVIVKVGESSRRQIEVSGIYGTDKNGTRYNIDDNGIVYGDRLTVRGVAQSNTQVKVMWVPDEGEELSSGPVDTHGTAFNYSFPADATTLGSGSVVVKYADNTALNKQGYYPGTVNWIREKPIEVPLRLRSALSEDSRNIELQTSPNAEIHLSVNGAEVDLEGNDHADEKGNWVYPLANNDKLRLKNENKVKIRVVDQNGETKESEEITVGGSNRKDITAEIIHLAEDTFYGETLKVTGIAERDVGVRVILMDADSNEMIDYKEVDCTGRYSAEFDAGFCGIPEDVGKKCYVSVEYADNLAESKFYPGTTPFTWIGHEQVDLKLEVKRLLEDSEAIRVETDPSIRVTVHNLTTDLEIDRHPADENGDFICNTAELEAQLKPREGDEIRVTVEDNYGNEKHTELTVGEAKRRQITVKVKEASEEGVVERENITVQGYAEPDQELVVLWLPDSKNTTAEQLSAKASINGWYEVELKKDGFTEGFGTIEVAYADGLAQSKAGNLETGRINWIQVDPTQEPTVKPSPMAIVTPAPTDTPAPPPTPGPTISLTPTPEPTKAPIVARVIGGITDRFGGKEKALKDWRFWALIAAALLLLAVIVVAIILLVRKAKKNRGMTTFTPSDDIQREGEFAEAGTERQRGPGDVGSTKRMGFGDTESPSSGTVNLPQNDFGFGSGNDSGGSGSGTIRLSAQNVGDSNGGTVRISQSAGPQPMLVRIHETRDWAGVNQDVTLSILNEAMVGRNEGNDLVIHDETVSGRHMKLIRRENNLFAMDLMSSNGTQLNGQRITVETQLNSGDVLTLGRTRLTLNFGE